MKVYISADIEGITGITHWDEAHKSSVDYKEFQDRMTDEVLAACEGAKAAGATEIYIKDAHASGRNLLAAKFPDYVHLIRGWSGHPFCMVQELDASFAALVFIGYHAKASSGDHPLAHSMSSARVFHIKINGQAVSEFILNSYAAATVGVPVAFLSGDDGLCDEVKQTNEAIFTVATMRGVGDSVISQSPHVTRAAIKDGVMRSLSRPLVDCKVALPQTFRVEMCFHHARDAYRSSFYPGAEALDARTIGFTSTNFIDVLTMIGFVIR